MLTPSATPDELHRALVRQRYGQIATEGRDCCDAECCKENVPARPDGVPEGADLGLSSGHPVSYARLRPGENVVDLGSGAGVDVFLAAKEVGPTGRAIGVDMTPEMLERARGLAAKAGASNVEFRQGVIEKLPLRDAEVHVVLSNCVVNLSADKAATFREAFRALKPGGRLVISDIVKERIFAAVGPSCGCIDGAMLRADYLRTIEAAGFANLEVLEERPWHTVDRQVLASSVTVRAWKPAA